MSTVKTLFKSMKPLDLYAKNAHYAPYGACVLFDYDDTVYTFGPVAVKVSKILGLKLDYEKLTPCAGSLRTAVCIIPSLGEAVAALQLHGQAVTVITKTDTGADHYTVLPLR